jgi:AcrR family transcriptional regulator
MNPMDEKLERSYISPTRAKTEQNIISVSRKLFEKRGIARTTIKDISKKANLTRPTVYSYFPTKNDIVLAVLYQSFIELYDFTIDTPDPASDPSPALTTFSRLFHTLLDRYLDHPNIMRLLVEYYQTHTTRSIEEEEGFRDLPGVRTVYYYKETGIEQYLRVRTDKTREQLAETFFTIFNFNIAVGMRYSLREDPFIGYESRISRDHLHAGLDLLVKLFD